MESIKEQLDLFEDEDLTERDLNPYKHADRKLITQPYDMSINTVIEQIENEDIILDPDYQREYRWDTIRASRFIESLLLNIPIPTIFLSEEEDLTYSVIDGQQRLTTLYNYVKLDEFPLEGLQIRGDLNELKFSDLDKRDQGKLLKQYLRCIVILNDSDPQIKFDVFERLNSGSSSLTDQEIRNCIYRGTFNNLIKNLGKDEVFLNLLMLPQKDSKNMASAEYVLRFFAYKLDFDNYDGSLKEFLNRFMKSKKNSNDLEKENKLFINTITLIQKVFGNKAFRRYIPDNKAYHRSINKAVFDAQMIAFSNIKFTNLNEKIIEKINLDFIELMSNEEYIKAIKSSTNAPEKVKFRILKTEEILLRYGVLLNDR